MTTAPDYSAWLAARSCITKRYYHTRSDAKRAKRAMSERYGCVFTIYRCSHCGGLHLTHQGRTTR